MSDKNSVEALKKSEKYVGRSGRDKLNSEDVPD